MFNKFTTFMIDYKGIEMVPDELIKTAAINLPDGFEYDPDFLYLKVRAVSAGEYWGDNKNADFFPEGELKPSYNTFLTAHTFKNHENKDVKNAIGDVLTAEWDDVMKSVNLLLRIDRKSAPGSIVRGYEKNFMTDVSMGCRIDHSVCSICGNKAKTKFEYCDHIKLERGRIYDDGRKVFEINIKPKFHDISLVLSGAEKVAKVTGIVIVGSKVAYNEPAETLEKVASDNSFAAEFEKVASVNVDQHIDIPFASLDKRANLQKKADIMKEIQGRIIDSAVGSVIARKQRNAEKAVGLLKMLYTNYWDRDKCYNIAGRIKQIAHEREVSVEQAFCEFLKVLDFAGIELSPLEIHDISCALSGINTPDLREIAPKEVLTPDELVGELNNAEETADEMRPEDEIDFPRVISTFRGLAPKSKEVASQIIGKPEPGKKVRALMIQIMRPVRHKEDPFLQDELMENIVGGEIPGRSLHRNFLMNRIMGEDLNPVQGSVAHFMPMRMMRSITKTASAIPFTMSGAVYAAYQNERVKWANEGETEKGVEKFASYLGESIFTDEISKEASTKNPFTLWRALKYGVPATYAYSALQRSRMNNRENVSSANRYVAENPGSASLMQAAFTPPIAYSAAKKTEPIKRFGRKALETLKKMPKKASENMFDNQTVSLYNGDIFNDSAVEKVAGYSSEKTAAIKEAIVLTGLSRGDAADEILARQNLSEEDMGAYLKAAHTVVVDSVEKIAEEFVQPQQRSKKDFAKEVAKSTAAGLIFNPRGISGLASLPGNLIDGILFTKLTSPNKASQGVQKTKTLDDNF